jgi:HSP20 family protein
MALPETPSTSWMQGFDLPSRLFEAGSTDYELYEEDDEFVLAVELPGFDPAEITVTWDEGILNVAGEREDEARGQRRTYHRRFRFPKAVDDDAIEAEYRNGVLEVRLPVEHGVPTRGTEIEVKS